MAAIYTGFAAVTQDNVGGSKLPTLRETVLNDADTGPYAAKIEEARREQSKAKNRWEKHKAGTRLDPAAWHDFSHWTKQVQQLIAQARGVASDEDANSGALVVGDSAAHLYVEDDERENLCLVCGTDAAMHKVYEEASGFVIPVKQGNAQVTRDTSERYTKEDVENYHKKYEEAKRKGDVTQMAKYLTLKRMAQGDIR